MALNEINKEADKSVGQAFLRVAIRAFGTWTDRNVCPTYRPTEGLATGFHSEANRPPPAACKTLITPM